MLLRCGGHSLDLARPVVMGVLNVTPDSFSDGGRFLRPREAVAHGIAMTEEGAGIIDVGGASTRPGAVDVAPEEELRRVLPVLEGLAGRVDAVLSIDTSRPEVIRAACAAGAGFVNDIRALRLPGALEAAAESGVAVGLMHMQGEPRTMQLEPRYREVVTEIRDFLAGRLQACASAGIAADRVVIDPGFGFGKSVEHNLRLLRELGVFRELGRPVLVGLSRKSMIGRLLGREAGERLYGSIALAAIAVLNGAAIVRAHDVAATVDAVRIAAEVRGS